MNHFLFPKSDSAHRQSLQDRLFDEVIFGAYVWHAQAPHRQFVLKSVCKRWTPSHNSPHILNTFANVGYIIGKVLGTQFFLESFDERLCKVNLNFTKPVSDLLNYNVCSFCGL